MIGSASLAPDSKALNNYILFYLWRPCFVISLIELLCWLNEIMRVYLTDEGGPGTLAIKKPAIVFVLGCGCGCVFVCFGLVFCFAFQLIITPKDGTSGEDLKKSYLCFFFFPTQVLCSSAALLLLIIMMIIMRSLSDKNMLDTIQNLTSYKARVFPKPAQVTSNTSPGHRL